MAEVLTVRYRHQGRAIAMGRLALANKKILFEYSPEFLDTRLELSPFKLPLKPGVIVCLV